MAHIETVDAPTLRRWLAAGEATLVDVRGDAAFAAEHIGGARSAPFDRLDPADLPAEPGRRLVFQCEAGILSERAAARAVEAGRGEVFNLAGGLRGWKRAGLPTVGGNPAPLSLERQTRIVAGGLVLAGTALGAVVSPWLLLLPAAVAAGLLWSGLTGRCGMAVLLLRLPVNRRGAPGTGG